MLGNLVVIIACLCLLASTARADISGKARVVDGDTIHIGKTKIRLHGIDAPEMQQEWHGGTATPYRCGEASPDALRVLAGADPARCEGDILDRYKRLIARCFVRGVDLNAEMVHQLFLLHI